METRHFTVDARAVIALGRDSIRDHTTALTELIKNAYDADATCVVVEIRGGAVPAEQLIRITDNGTGMDKATILDRWLRIGYSAKREETVSRLNRRRTGEKGVGRLSADRLGARFEMRTRTPDGRDCTVSVNWDDFDKIGAELSEVPVTLGNEAAFIAPTEWPEGAPPFRHGTQLEIASLRQTWTPEDVGELHDELAILTPPFDSVLDFAIVLSADVAPGRSGLVFSEFSESAEIDVSLAFDGIKTLTMSSVERDEHGRRLEAHSHELDWTSAVQRTDERALALFQKPNVGPTRVRLLFFPRKAEVLRGSDWSMSKLRGFLDANAGVRIYRDNIRVKPYGDPNSPEQDWLKLGERKVREPAGATRPTYRVSPNQVVGAAFIGRDDNPLLKDSTGREGLIEGQAFGELRTLVFVAVLELERLWHEASVRAAERPTEPERSASVKSIGEGLDTLAQDLRKLLTESAPNVAQTEKAKSSLLKLEALARKAKLTGDEIEEAASQNTIYRGLATLGIASAVFGHEIATSIGQVKGAATAASKVLKLRPPDVPAAEEQLQSLAQHADRIAAWGSFALNRVRRDKRRRRASQVQGLINELLDQLTPAVEAVEIRVERVLTPVNGRVFPMDIEAVLINLVANAYTAVMQQRKDRVIRIALSAHSSQSLRKGFELVVSDSGAGVPEKYRTRIWEPLFSTKVDASGGQSGTGLGLSIVRSVVDDLHGERRVDSDPELGGARFIVRLPMS